MLSRLGALACRRPYWFALVVFALVLLAAALYYQHVLDEWPCVLCIQVRIILLLILITALPALLWQPRGKGCVLTQLLITAWMATMLNRSWILFATERGLIESACGVSLGLPSWLALEQWLPDIFGVWASCGYTPIIALGISMAEVLLVISAAWLLLSVLILTALMRDYFRAR